MIAEELRKELTPLQQAVILRLWDITSSEVTLHQAVDGGVICHLCRIPPGEANALRDSDDCLEKRMELENRFSLFLARDGSDAVADAVSHDSPVALTAVNAVAPQDETDCILLEIWGRTVDDALAAMLLQLGKLWNGWHLKVLAEKNNGNVKV